MGKDKQKQPKHSPVQLHIKETNIYEQGKGSTKVKEVTDTIESTKRVKKGPVDIQINGDTDVKMEGDTSGNISVATNMQTQVNEKSPQVEIEGPHFEGDLQISSKPVVSGISPDVKKVERIHQTIDTNEAFREFQEAMKVPGMGVRFETVTSTDNKIITTYVQRHEEDNSFEQTTTIQEIKRTIGTLPKGNIDIRSPGLLIKTPSHEETGHAELDLPNIPKGSVEITPPDIDLELKGSETPGKKHKIGGKFGLFGKRKTKDKEDKDSDKSSETDKMSDTNDPKHPKWELPRFNIKKGKGGGAEKPDTNIKLDGEVGIDGEFGGKPYPLDGDLSATDSEQDQVTVHVDVPSVPELYMSKDDNDKTNEDGSVEIVAGAPDIDININGKKPKFKNKRAKEKKHKPKQLETENVDIDIKEEGKFGIHLPKFKFGKGKKGEYDVSGSTEMPGAKIEIDDPDIPVIDGKQNVNKPDVDIGQFEGEMDTDVDIREGEKHKIKFGFPSFKHGGKQEEEEEVDVDIKQEGTGGTGGFSINLPKFKFGKHKKGEYDVSIEGEEPDKIMHGDVDGGSVEFRPLSIPDVDLDTNLPDANISADIGSPDIDVNVVAPDIPDVGIDGKTGDMDLSGDASLDRKHKIKFGLPSIKFGGKQGEEENIDVDVKEEDTGGSGGFGIHLPKFKFGKGKKGDINVEGDIPEADISGAANVGGIDMDINGPELPNADIDGNLKGDIEIEGPEADVNLSSNDVTPKGKHKFKFGLPKFKFGKGKKPDLDASLDHSVSSDVPDANISAEINPGDLDIDVKKPELPDVDMSADIKGPDVDIHGTSSDISGDASLKRKHKIKFGLPSIKFGGKQGEEENVDVDVKEEGTGGSGGFGIHLPKFKFGKGKKGDIKVEGDMPNADISGDIDVKTPSLPDVNVDAGAFGDIKGPGMDINVDGPDVPNVDIGGKHDMDISGDASLDRKNKIKFGLPSIKFGGKQGEQENIDVDVKEEGTGGSGGFGIHLPKFKFGKGKKGNINVGGDLPESDISGDIDINRPTVPDVDGNISGEIEGPDVDVNMDVPELPDVDLDGPQVDMDLDGNTSTGGKHKFKFGLPNVKFGGKQGETENVDVDVKEEGTGGSGGFGISLPKVNFRKGKKGAYDVNMKGDIPEADISGNADVTLPDANISADIGSPDVDVNVVAPDIPDVDIDGKTGDMDLSGDASLDRKHKIKFGLPSIKFGGKQGEEENIDVDVKEEGTGGSGGFGIHLPKFKFGKGKKGDVNVEGDLPEADISGDANVGGIDMDINGPELPNADIDLKGDIDIEGPEADVNLSGNDVTPKSKHKFKFGLPKFKFGKGKKPDLDASLDHSVSSDVPDANISAEINPGDLDIDVKKPELPDVDMSADIKGPDVDIDGTSSDISGDASLKRKHKIKFGLPSIRFGGKQGEEENVDVDVKEEGTGGSGGFGIHLPKFKFGKGKKGDIKVKGDMPDTDISGDIHVKTPSLPDVNVDAGASGDIKGPGMDINVDGPDVPNVDIGGKHDMDISGDASLDRKNKIKFGLPSIKFGGKQGEEENIDVDVKEEGTGGSGGFGIHLPKFKFGKGKKGNINVGGDLPESDISGDIDINYPTVPNVDGNISGEIEGPDVDVNMDVPELPDVDLDGPQVDMDLDGNTSTGGKRKFKFGLPNVKFGGKQGETENVDVDVKEEGTGGSGGFGISLPKVNFRKGKKGAYDVNMKGDIPDADISGNADVTLPDANISADIGSPDVDVNVVAPDIPDVDIDGKTGDMDLSGNASLDRKHKIKFGLPSINFGGKQGEEENIDVDVKEEGTGGSGGFGIHLPKFKFGKGKKGDVNVDGDLPEADISGDAKVGGIDMDINGPELPNADIDLKGDIDIEGPEADVNLSGNDVTPKGKHKFKFGLPKFKFGKGKKPDLDASLDHSVSSDVPDANISAEINPGDLDIDVKKPELPDVDMSADIKGPDVDIDGTSSDISGDASLKRKHKIKFGLPSIKFGGKQGEEENVDVDVKEEGTGGSGGFGIHLPKFKFGKGKKGDIKVEGDMPNADISGDIDVKTPSLPDVNVDAGASGDIKGPGMDINVDGPDVPNVDIGGKHDMDISGEASLDRKNKIKFGLPSIKFGGKQGEEENIDVDVKEEGTGGSGGFGIHLPKFKFGKGKKGNINVGGDIPESDISGDIDINRPTVPDVDGNISGEIEGPDVDVNMDVPELPDVDLDGPQLDMDLDGNTSTGGKHKFKFGLPNVKFGGKQGETENVDVDVKEEGTGGSGGFGFSLPKVNFRKGKKGAYDVNMKGDIPDADISGNADVTLPDANISADIGNPDIDVNVVAPDIPDVDIDGKTGDMDLSGDASLDRKHKIKFGLPSIKFGGKQGEEENIDVDVKEEGTGGSGGFGIHLPKFKFGKGKKGDVNVDGDLPEADISGDANVGGIDMDINGPELPNADIDLKGDIDIEGPEADVNLSGNDVTPKGKHKFKFGLPKFKFGKGKKPDLDASLDHSVSSDVPDANISAEINPGDLDIDVKKPELPDVDMSADIKGPDVDIDGTSSDISGDASLKRKHKIKFGLPSIKFGGKQGEKENVDVDVKEESTGGSGGFGIHLPKFKFRKGKKGDIKVEGDMPDADISGDIDVKTPSLPDVNVDAGASGDIKGPGMDINVDGPDVPNVDIGGKHDMDISGDASLDRKNKIKFGLPSIKFGGKQGEEENIDVDVKEEGTGGSGGFGIHLPKFKFGKGKKGNINVGGDIPESDISGDIDINHPTVPDVDGNISGEIEGPDVDVNMDVPELPDVDLDGPQVDMDLDGNTSTGGKHKFKFGLPNVKFGGKQGETENVDVDVKEEGTGSGGFGISLPKVNFRKGKKGAYDVNMKGDIPDADISGNADVTLPDANISADIGCPDVDVNVVAPDIPDVDIDGKTGDMDLSGDASLDRKHKIKFGLPSINFGGKQGEEENIDVDVKEEGTGGSGGFGIHLPKFKFGKGKKGDVNVDGDLPEADISGDANVGGIDMDINGPELPNADIDLKGDIDIEGPEADVNLSGNDVTPKGKHKFKFGLPKFKFGKGKKPDLDASLDHSVSSDVPDANISAEINPGDLDIDVKKPELPDVDMSADIKGPDVDIDGTSSDISGDASLKRKHKIKFGLPSIKFGGKQGEEENVDVDVKEEGTGGSGGFGIHLPKFKFGKGKKGDIKVEGDMPDADISGDIDVKTPSLPDVNVDAGASGDIKGPGMDINVDGPDVPNVDIGGKHDMDISGDASLDRKKKIKFGLPSIKFGGKQGEEENIDVDVKEEGTGGSGGFGIHLPKFKFGKGKKGNINVGGDLPESDISGDIDINRPTVPDVDGNISGEIEGPGVDVNMDVPELPDVDLDGPQVDMDLDGNTSTGGKHKFKFGLPNVKFGGKQGETENVDVDVKEEGTGGSGGFGISLPKVNFRKGKKGAYDVNMKGDIPDADISGNADVTLPDANISADIDSPDVDVNVVAPDIPDVDIDGKTGDMDLSGDASLDQKHKIKFGLPSIKFGGKQGEEENIDVDVKEEGTGGSGGFGIHLPKFKFGKGKKGDVNVEGDLPEADISGDANVGGIDMDINGPELPNADIDLKGDIDIDGPEADVNLSSNDVTPKGKHKFKFGLPKFKFGKGKKPDLDASLDHSVSSDVPDANISAEINPGDLDIDVKKPELPDVDMSADIKGPDVDIDGTSSDISGDASLKRKHKIKFGLPSIRFGGKQGEKENVDVDVKEEGTGGSGGFGIHLPKFKFGKGKKGDIKVEGDMPDADISGDIDVKTPSLPDVNVDAGASGDIKGPGMDINVDGPDVPNVDIGGKHDMDISGDASLDRKNKIKFGLPSIKFGGKQGEEENIDVDVKEEGTGGSGGFGIHLPKFKFGKGKKGNINVVGDIPESDISGDIDINHPTVPDVDGNISGEIEGPGVDVNMDVPELPDVDLDGPQVDMDLDGNTSTGGKHKFKFGLPNVKFGGKQGETENVDVDVKEEGTGGSGGFGISLPKVNFRKGKKGAYDVNMKGDIPDADISGNADVTLPDANISADIDSPDVDVNVVAPDIPDVDIDGKTGDMDLSGDASLDRKHKIKFGLPSIKFGGKQGEEENIDVDVKEEGTGGSGGFGIHLPKFKFGKGKKGDVNVEGDLPEADISGDANVGGIDMDINGPELPNADIDLKGDIDIDGPEADVNLSSNDVTPKGKHKFKFGLPKFKFGKGKKPDLDASLDHSVSSDVPDANISAEINPGDLDIDVKKPELPDVDMSADIKGPDVDIDGTSSDISGDASLKRKHKIKFGLPSIRFGGKQGEKENVDVDVKEEGTGGSGGFGIHLPKFKFGKGKKGDIKVEGDMPDADISGDIDVKTPSLPDVNVDAGASGDIKGPGMDINVDGPDVPNVDIGGKHDMDISGDASLDRKNKIKFGLPSIKFGGKQGEEENIDVDVKEEGTGGSGGFGIHLPKFKFGKGKKGNINVVDDIPESDISGDIDINHPTVPDVDGNISGEIEGPDVDVNMDVPELPDVDLDGPQVDMDLDGNTSTGGKHKFKFGLPNVKFGGKQGETENVDVDVKEEGTGGSGGFGISLPKVNFRKGKKGAYDVNMKGDIPDADISGNADVTLPDANISADIGNPDVDVNVVAPDIPDVDIDGKTGDMNLSGDASLDRKHKIKFGLPSIKFGGKQGEEENIDVDVKEEGTGGSGGFGIHLPKFKFGKGKKGDVNVEGDLPEADISGDANVGGIDMDINGPELPNADIDLKGDIHIDGPEADVNLSSNDVTPKGKHKFKFGLPKFKFGKGKKPDLDASLDHSVSSDVPDANISAEINPGDLDIDVKKPELPDVDMSADIKGPDVDIDGTSSDISGDASLKRKHKIKFGLPSIKFGGKQGEEENVDVDVKEEGTGGSGGFGIHLPKFKFGKGKKGDIKVEGDMPDADISGDIDVKTPSLPDVNVDAGASGDIKGPGMDINVDGPDVPNVDIGGKHDMDISGDASLDRKNKIKFGLPSIKFGGKQGEEENIDVDVKEEGTGGSGGFGIHLPKFKFGKGKKGNINVGGDLPESDISGDIDINRPTVPDVDGNISGEIEGPDVDVNMDVPKLPDVDLDGPQVDMDLDGNTSTGGKHKFKFGLPNVKFGGKQGETENVDVDVKEEGTGGSGGFGISLPKVNFRKGKKGAYDVNMKGDIPDADISGNADVTLPDANISADIDSPDVDVNVVAPDIPDVDIDGKTGDMDLSGDASLDRKHKIKFGLPSIKFGGKQGEEENIDVDVKEEGTGGSGGFGIHLPKFKFGKGKKGEVNVEGDLPGADIFGDANVGGIDMDINGPELPNADIDLKGDIDIEGPEADVNLSGNDVTPKGKHKFKFGLPKFKFGKGKKPDLDASLDHSVSSDVPDANISAEINPGDLDIDVKKSELPDVDMSADIKGPDVDIDGTSSDISGDASLKRKHKIKFGLPSIKFGGKQGEEENVDVDVKEEGTGGSGGFGIHLPKFKFGKGKKGDIKVEGDVPDADISGDIDVKTPSLPDVNVDAGASGDIKGPGMDINVDGPDVPNVDIGGKHDMDISGDASLDRKNKIKFGLPSIKFGGKQGEEENIDVDVKEEGTGGSGGFGIHLPKFKFGKGKKGNINVGGDLPESDISGDIDINRPTVPDVDGNISGEIEGPGVDVNMDVPELPDVDLDGPQVDMDLDGNTSTGGKHKFKFGLPNVKFGGKQGETENVDVDVKEEGTGGSGGFGISLPKVNFRKGKKGAYDVNMKGDIPDADISGNADVTLPDANISADIGSPDVDVNVVAPDIPDVDIDGKTGDMDLSGDASLDRKHKIKFGLPSIKFGGKQGEEENIDVDVKEEGTGGSGGFGIHLPKFKFGKGKKGDVNVDGDLPEADISGDAKVGGIDMDINGPELPNADIDLKGDIDIEGPEADVNLSGNDVTPKGKRKFKFGLPKFKFGKGKKPDLDVSLDHSVSSDVPDANISAEIDPGDLDINVKKPEIPDVDMSADINGPDIDANVHGTDIPDVNIDGTSSDISGDASLKRKHKIKFGLPSIKFGGKQGEEENVNVDVKEEGTGGSGGFGIHLPKFKLRKGRKGEYELNSANDVSGPNIAGGIDIETDTPNNAHADINTNSPGQVEGPGFDINVVAPVIPNYKIDSDLKADKDKRQKEEEHVDVDIKKEKTGFDIHLPRFKLGKGKKGSYNVNVINDLPEVRGNVNDTPAHLSAECDLGNLELDNKKLNTSLGTDDANINPPHIPGTDGNNVAVSGHIKTGIDTNIDDGEIFADVNIPKPDIPHIESEVSNIDIKGQKISPDFNGGTIHIAEPAISINIPETEIDSGDKKKKRFTLPKFSPKWKRRSKSPGVADDSFAQYGHSDSKHAATINLAAESPSLNIAGEVPWTNSKLEIDPKVQGSRNIYLDVNKDVPFAKEEANPLQTYEFPFENLVLQGKGSDCIAHVGVMKKLHEAGIYQQLTKFSGSGFGGLTAALLASGAGLKTMEIWLNNDIPKLTTARAKCLPINVVRKYGHTPEERIQNWLGQKLKCLLGDPNTTFSQLQNSKGKELTLIVTNASQMKTEKLTPKTTPNLPIKVGVRMCLAYQGLFKPVHYKIHDTEDTYISGCLLTPYPIDTYDGAEAEGEPGVPNDKTLGVLLHTSAESRDLSSQHSGSSHDERPVDVTGPRTPTAADGPVDPKDLATPMLRFLQTLHKYKVDKNCNGISKNDLDNMLLQRTSLPHDDLKLLFGEKKTVDEIFGVIGAKSKNEISYKELLAYFEKKLNHHTKQKSGTLGRSKQQNKLETVYISVQEVLSTAGIPVHMPKQDLDRTIRIDTGDVCDLDMGLEDTDRLYLMQEGQLSTEEFLKNYIEDRGLEPTSVEAGAGNDPDVQFLLTREDISEMIDEELSEIINERDYNENCTYVGEYT